MAKEKKRVPPNNSFYTTKFSNYHPDRIRDLCGQSCHTCSMPCWPKWGSRERCARACCSCSMKGPTLPSPGTPGQYGLSCYSCSMRARWDFVGNPWQCVQLRCSGSTYLGPLYIRVQSGQSGCICSISVDLPYAHNLHLPQILLLDILERSDQCDCTYSTHWNSSGSVNRMSQ